MKTRIKSALLYGLVFLLLLGLTRFLPYLLSFFLFILLYLSERELSFLLSEKEADTFERIISFLQGLSFLILPLYILFNTNLSNDLLSAYTSKAELGALESWQLALIFLAWNFLLASLLLARNLLRLDPQELPRTCLKIFTNLYLSTALFSMNFALYTLPFAWEFLCLCFITPWISDSFAYICGKSLGKRKICPRISPNKTLAGALGSLIVTALSYLLAYIVLREPMHLSKLNIFIVIGIGLLASALCQLGDLFASGLKRNKGVKDSGELIPGHGGIMDRLDSTYFLFPFMTIIALLIHYI